MRDMSHDWCFEGGCTYDADVDTLMEGLDTGELEAMYMEPCIGMAD